MWAWTGWSLSFHCFDKTVVKVSALILRWKHQVLSLWGICHSSSRLWFSSMGDLVRIRRFHTCNCVCSCGISCCTWLLDVRCKPNSGSRKSHKVRHSKITHFFFFFLQRVVKTMFGFKMSQAEFVSPDICDCRAQAIRRKMPFLLVHSVADWRLVYSNTVSPPQGTFILVHNACVHNIPINHTLVRFPEYFPNDNLYW